MGKSYSDEKNVQLLITHLKARGIKKIIASPGTTNINFVKSLQSDNYFDIYSAVDERSAAYMACGMAYESKEPVVITCTGATASRNYYPGITEANYRKLPIIAITATQPIERVGHHVAQVTDRSIHPKDTYVYSSVLNIPNNNEQEWDLEVKLNRGYQKLIYNGGGPIHFNLVTGYSNEFNVSKLQKPKLVNFFFSDDDLPIIKAKKVSIIIGSHKIFTASQVREVELFCEKYNGVVLIDHTSGYHGKYSIQHSLVSSQKTSIIRELQPDLTIQLGEITGDYSYGRYLAKRIWRVNIDGELRDNFHRLENVFQFSITSFFKFYNLKNENSMLSFYELWRKEVNILQDKIPNLPFSNIWLAHKMHNDLPKNSVIHLGILNSLRSWNFFEIDQSIHSMSNVGGFGIDGNLSSILGSSLVDSSTLYYMVIGDLAFFYDMNSLGNRHVGSNLRILLINNGVGTEFRNSSHRASNFHRETNEFIAAKGHFGNKSATLVKNYAEALGFTYLVASDKNQAIECMKEFLNPAVGKKSIIFEVFTNDYDESKALEVIMSLSQSSSEKVKTNIKKIVGKKNLNRIKKAINR